MNKASPTVLVESRLALQMVSGRASQGGRRMLLALLGEVAVLLPALPTCCCRDPLSLSPPLWKAPGSFQL